MRGFNVESWIVIGISVPVVLGVIFFSKFAASKFGIAWIVIFLFISAVIWLLMHSVEKFFKRRIVDPELDSIDLDWEVMLDDNSFPIDDIVAESISEIVGFKLDNLGGKILMFVTTNPETKEDVYFEGKLVIKASGSLVVPVRKNGEFIESIK